jgi:tetratricopeptide (TPR) repeat protein
VARTLVRGLLIPDREQRPADTARPGKGLQPPAPSGERSIESRLLELQSTAGNLAVQRYIQGQRAAPVVQRDPVVAEGGAEVPARAAGDDGILRYGSRGDDVRTLQERLNKVGAGRPPLVLDGIFGRKTQRAVRAFQRANPPLVADGDAGPETLPVLEQAAPAQGGTEATTPVGSDAGATTGDAGTTGADATSGTDTDATQGARSDQDVGKELFEQGRALYAAGSYGQAYDEFSKAFDITGDASLLWNRANCLRIIGGRRTDAIALYEQFLATNVDADAERRQARDYIEELRGTGATGNATLDKAMLYSYNRTGSELYKAGEYAKAFDEFSKAWDVSGDAAMLWNRAHCLRLMGGRRAEAIALYEQFRSIVVADEPKATAAEFIANLRGPARGADAAANKQSAVAVFTEGQEHYGAGRYAEASDKFAIAYDIDPDPAYLYNRAQALRSLGGRREEAIRLYEQFLSLNIGDDAKAIARSQLADLRGPGRSSANPGPNAVGAPAPSLP